MRENPRIPRRLIGGVYRIGQVLTAGQMLTTYTAHDHNTNDVVGLFVIEIPPAIQPAAAQQLVQPLEQRQSIHSPHVIRVHGWGIEGSHIYIATDPPRGTTLQYVLDNEDIDKERALDLSRQIALGLQELHNKGISGLDLRPQLVTVDSVGITDRVQIDDIGLRSLLNALGYMNSQRPDDIGYPDPRYLSPEYINKGQIGPWSDIYQLGLLFFSMITGRLPFVGRNHAETGILQSTAPIPRMSQFKHGVPVSYQNIVDSMLAKEPTWRFANTEELLAAFDAAQLPPPSQSGQAAADQDAAAAQPSTALTSEMQSIEDEVTVRAPGSNVLVSSKQGDSTPTVDDRSETGVYAYLRFEKQGAATQRFALRQKSVVVGRTDPKRGLNPDIDLSALDPKMTISRQHARIRFEETFFYIEDLKSRNKTRLGQLVLTPLKAELLQHGDVVFFGSVRMRFEIPGMGKLPPLKETPS
ncbi:MAG: protein kinase [Chloroflexi bacterium]|nr:protein kinase [Chloroflexota bacterium]